MGKSDHSAVEAPDGKRSWVTIALLICELCRVVIGEVADMVQSSRGLFFAILRIRALGRRHL
jgi:hypothetical protein